MKIIYKIILSAIMVVCLAIGLGNYVQYIKNYNQEKISLSDSKNRISLLKKWDFSDPLSASQKAIDIGDCHFIAVEAFTTELPGVPPDQQWALISSHQATIIEGTSDTRSEGEEESLNRKAIEYAKLYNENILASKKCSRR